MAFGDGGNDITMLKHVKVGVAMGNANPDLNNVEGISAYKKLVAEKLTPYAFPKNTSFLIVKNFTKLKNYLN